VALYPQIYHQRLIDTALVDEAPVELEVVMEILELDESGRALLWIPDAQDRQFPRIAAAQLSPDRRAEILLAQANGYTAHITLVFTVLGRQGNGGYGATVSDPEGLLSFEPLDPDLSLYDLLG
jgi:hypothetical protein